MKSGAPRGYTIVEVMIFLAVSGGLLAMAILVFSGQQGRTQFATGAREIESRVRDVINDVSTGYYARSSSFDCTAGAAGPQIAPGGTFQGQNDDCIFLGRVIHFDVGGNGNQYNIYSVAGLRQVQSGPDSEQDVTDFDEAQPTASPLLAESLTLPAGISAERIQVNGTTHVDAVGFMTTLGSYSPGNATLEPGSLSVDVLPIIGGGAGNTNQASMIGDINDIDESYADANRNPANGVVICFQSGGSNQHAILTIGGSGRQLTTEMVIGEGSC